MGVYAPQDYVVYIAILVVILYILTKVFERIRLDETFIYAITPCMFIGILVRVLADVGYFPKDQAWSITPGVYILAILVAVSFLAAGYVIQRAWGISYHKTALFLGVASIGFLLYELAPYTIKPGIIPQTLFLTLVITTLVWALDRLLRTGIYGRKSNVLILFAQMLDAASTFIAYDYHDFTEEHLLPQFLFDLFGDSAAVMIPVKMLVVTLTLYYVEKWYAEEEKTGRSRTLYLMVKLLVFILGIGPGTRNLLLPALDMSP